MAYASELEHEFLVDVMRTPPRIAPEDSLQRFIEVIGYTPYSMLPVVSGETIVGFMHEIDVHFLLALDPGEERSASSHAAVQHHMRPVDSILNMTDSVEQASLLCAAAGLDMIAIVDPDGRYRGVIVCRDLLFGSRPQGRLYQQLPSIGGMATPFGVYLSDGVHQAGASNLSLVAGGAALAVCAVVADMIVHALIMSFGTAVHHDYSYLTPEYTPPPGQLAAGLWAVGLHLLISLVFLTLIRISKIAGFHAAEHQTVHAIEHGEPLAREIVARMPRPHPRCGTNILAAGILFWNLSALFRALPGSDSDTAAVVAVVVTFFTWRRFGTFLQATFTTRPARPRELDSGIAAANSLLSQYRQITPQWIGNRTRARLFRRLWCSGLLQSMAGMLPTITLLTYLLSRWLY